MLVGEVCRHKGNLAAELRGYKEQMKPIIGDLQKISSFVLTIFAPQMTWGIWPRNNIFAFIAWTRTLEFVQKFFAAPLPALTNTDSRITNGWPKDQKYRASYAHYE